MGWSGTNGKVWGDAPQDVVSAVAAAYFPDMDAAPLNERRKVATKLLADADFRESVDEEYKQGLGRSATDWEFRNLINVALNVGDGRTLDWERSTPKRSAKIVRRKTKSSPSGLGGMK